MSTPTRQRRPSRDETRNRLLEGAAESFIDRGIAGASVEDICDAAGLSRGAFYSNFADKDELVLALIERMTEDSLAEIANNLANHPDPDDYIAVTQLQFRDRQGRIGNRHPALSVELTLYAMRNPKAQPLLRARLDRHQELIQRVVEHNANALGLGPANNRSALAAMILAMDDGFCLHALIDPARDPRESFNVALAFLAEAGHAIAFVEQGQTHPRTTSPTATRKQRTATSTKKTVTK
jgi:AcrR family transcriptional regulator